MHPGVFKGEKAEHQKIKVLMLGESHHWSKEDWVTAEGETEAQAEERRKEKAANYKTETVVKNYLLNYEKTTERDKAYRFFDKIVLAFGFDPEIHREYFWDHVWFGNYIDELCGVGDSQATNLLKEEDNRIRYNDDLFDFVANEKIDIIFCFSRRVYNKLPSLVKATGENENTINVGDFLRAKDGTPKKDYISYCKYLPGAHNHTSKPIKRTVEVYGMLHPSGRYGFAPENYAPELKKQINF